MVYFSKVSKIIPEDFEHEVRSGVTVAGFGVNCLKLVQNQLQHPKPIYAIFFFFSLLKYGPPYSKPHIHQRDVPFISLSGRVTSTLSVEVKPGSGAIWL